MAEQGNRPIEWFEGAGNTLEAAFQDAAEKAIRASAANDGKQFVVLHHRVTVSNPRIREHSVVLGSTS